MPQKREPLLGMFILDLAHDAGIAEMRVNFGAVSKCLTVVDVSNPQNVLLPEPDPLGPVPLGPEPLPLGPDDPEPEPDGLLPLCDPDCEPDNAY